MQFPRWHEGLKRTKDKTIQQDYDEAMATVVNPAEACLLTLEKRWWEGGRPYFKVWPDFVAPLVKLGKQANETMRFSDYCNVSDPVLSVRFAEGSVRTALVGIGTVASDVPTVLANVDFADGRLLFFGAVADERDKLDDSLLERGDGQRDEDGEAVFWIAVALFVLERDPTFFEPDILARDADRFANGTDDEKCRLIARAESRRNEGRGFHVGRCVHLEQRVAHVRRPHFGLRWTGKGGAIPRIVPVRGSLVSGREPGGAVAVPTGYHGG